jgi:hypothetical protein
MTDHELPRDPSIDTVSDAAARMRLHVRWIRSDAIRAVAVEESVDRVTGVRAVHAYPRTASVVVWYSQTRGDRAEILAAITEAAYIPADQLPDRAPRSADVTNADIVRMMIGGAGSSAPTGGARYVLRYERSVDRSLRLNSVDSMSGELGRVRSAPANVFATKRLASSVNQRWTHPAPGKPPGQTSRFHWSAWVGRCETKV